MSKQMVSPEWKGFRFLWIVVAIILFLLLLLMWLFGYGPGGKSCQVNPVKTIVTPAVDPVVMPSVDPSKLVAPDKSAPKISLKDGSTVRFIAGQTFTDPGATALDNVDGNITVKVTGEVDNNTPGEYELIYKATDLAGNTRTQIRKVIVEPKMPEVAISAPDKSAPKLTLNGDSVITIAAGTSFTDEGAKATDAIDGEVKVVVTGKVDSKTQGEYALTYTAVDAAGNKATVKRKVIVTAAASNTMLLLPSDAKLYFENDDSEFPADTTLSLSSVISYLRNNKSSTAIISGYHSASGNLARNQELSLARAQSVVKLLLDAGIPAARMKLEKPRKSKGSGSAEEARRVEVKVVN